MKYNIKLAFLVGIIIATLSVNSLFAEDKTKLKKIISLKHVMTDTVDKKHNKINISMNAGSITLSSWKKKEISLEYKVRTLVSVDEDQEKIDELKSSMKMMYPELSKVKKTIKIVSKKPKELKKAKIYSTLDVKVPKKLDIVIQTDEGDIYIKAIDGDIRCESDAGIVSVEDIKGTAEIKVDCGNIIIQKVGDGIKAYTKSGDVTVYDVKKGAQIETGQGDVNVSNTEGDINVLNEGGNVVIDDNEGDVSIINYDGNVEVNEIDGGVNIKSSGGNIKIARVSGLIDAENRNGDVILTFNNELPDTGLNRIVTVNGDVIVYAPKTLQANIEAEVNLIGDEELLPSYSINDLDFENNNLNFESEGDGKYRRFRVNGGGGRVNLTASNGNIVLKIKI